jgi:hypothetical protein
MSEMQGETPLYYQHTLRKNEGQEGKAGPFQEWVPVRGGRTEGKVNKDEYGVCISYSCMKIE